MKIPEVDALSKDYNWLLENVFTLSKEYGNGMLVNTRLWPQDLEIDRKQNNIKIKHLKGLKYFNLSCRTFPTTSEIFLRNCSDLEISNCRYIKNLKGMPILKNSNVDLRGLTQLEELPTSLLNRCNEFSMSNCVSLTSITPNTLTTTRDISISECSNLTSIEHLPQELDRLELIDNFSLTSMSSISKNLKTINKGFLLLPTDVKLLTNLINLMTIKYMKGATVDITCNVPTAIILKYILARGEKTPEYIMDCSLELIESGNENQTEF